MEKFMTNGLVKSFCVAGIFLTRLPFKVSGDISHVEIANSVWVFPIIGLIVGVIGSGTFLLSMELGFGSLVSASLGVLSLILVTGGLHEDGLADTVDGFAGGADPKAKLKIMRESQIGVFGAIAVMFSILLRCLILADISGSNAIFFGYIVSGVVSRGILPITTFFLEPARQDGLAFEMGKLNFRMSLVSIMLTLLIMVLLMDFSKTIIICVAVFLTVGSFMAVVYRQIGGYTGDVFGAYQQITEVASLLVLGVYF